MEVRFLVRCRIVECNLVCDRGVDGLDGSCLDGSVGDSVGCYCFPGHYEGDFVVVKYFLQSVGISFTMLVPDCDGEWSWLPCMSAIVQWFSS